MYTIYFLNTLATTVAPITDDGGISAGWAIVIMGAMISSMVCALFYILNNTINSIRKDVAEIKYDLHRFMEQQSGLNATLFERTKDL